MPEIKYENPDLRRERSGCQFDKEEITNLIDGGVEKTKERRELGNSWLFKFIAWNDLVILYELTILIRGIYFIWPWTERSCSSWISQSHRKVFLWSKKSLLTFQKIYGSFLRVSKKIFV